MVHEWIWSRNEAAGWICVSMNIRWSFQCCERFDSDEHLSSVSPTESGEWSGGVEVEAGGGEGERGRGGEGEEPPGAPWSPLPLPLPPPPPLLHSPSPSPLLLLPSSPLSPAFHLPLLSPMLLPSQLALNKFHQLKVTTKFQAELFQGTNVASSSAWKLTVAPWSGCCWHDLKKSSDIHGAQQKRPLVVDQGMSMGFMPGSSVWDYFIRCTLDGKHQKVSYGRKKSGACLKQAEA